MYLLENGCAVSRVLCMYFYLIRLKLYLLRFSFLHPYQFVATGFFLVNKDIQ